MIAKCKQCKVVPDVFRAAGIVVIRCPKCETEELSVNHWNFRMATSATDRVANDPETAGKRALPIVEELTSGEMTLEKAQHIAHRIRK